MAGKMQGNGDGEFRLFHKGPETVSAFELLHLPLGIGKDRFLVLYHQWNHLIQELLFLRGEVLKGAAPTQTPQQKTLLCHLLDHRLPVTRGLLHAKLDELPGNSVHFRFDPIRQGRFHQTVQFLVLGFHKSGSCR